MKSAATILALCVLALLAFNECQALTSGSFKVYNSGGYVARFTVRYQLGGQMQTYYSGDFALGQERYLEIPYGATYREIVIEKAVFFGSWNGVLSQGFDGAAIRCYKIWGTIFQSAWAEEDC